MKCPNCGAELQTDQVKDIRFCPYCGKEMQITEEVPTTIAGAIHGLGKRYLNQQAEKELYEREHADEIAKQKKEKTKQDIKSTALWALLMLAIPFVIYILGKLAGFK